MPDFRRFGPPVALALGLLSAIFAAPAYAQSGIFFTQNVQTGSSTLDPTGLTWTLVNESGAAQSVMVNFSPAGDIGTVTGTSCGLSFNGGTAAVPAGQDCSIVTTLTNTLPTTISANVNGGTAPGCFGVGCNVNPGGNCFVNGVFCNQNGTQFIPYGYGNRFFRNNNGLTLSKSVSNSNPTVGGDVVWTVTVTNNSSFTDPNVQVTDQLASGLGLVSASATAGFYSGSLWSGFGLNPSQSATLQLETTVNASAQNCASAIDGRGDSAAQQCASVNVQNQGLTVLQPQTSSPNVNNNTQTVDITPAMLTSATTTTTTSEAPTTSGGKGGAFSPAYGGVGVPATGVN